MTSNLARLKPENITRILSSGSALRELKKVDPSDRYVLLFPDSDRVHVGMGLNLLNSPAEDVFFQAEKLLNKNLLQLCLEGPRSDLRDSLENRSLAAFVTSHALVTKLSHEQKHTIELCKAAGGIGVGFVNSLVFSGAMTFVDGLNLVQKRAQAMERIAKVVPSARLFLRLRPATRKHKVCAAAVEHCLKSGIPKEVAVCSVTKQISPHHIEVGGHEEAIKYLESEGPRLFEFYKIRRLEGDPSAYNTELMRPAQQYIHAYMNQNLKENANYLKDPSTCSVYSATSGCRLRLTKTILQDLCDFPVKPILVEQLLDYLFKRGKGTAMPNTLVVWDKNLFSTLASVNERAYRSARLLRA